MFPDQSDEVVRIEIPEVEWVGDLVPIGSISSQRSRGSVGHCDVEFAAGGEDPMEFCEFAPGIGEVFEAVGEDGDVEAGGREVEVDEVADADLDPEGACLRCGGSAEVCPGDLAATGLEVEKEVAKAGSHFEHSESWAAINGNIDVELVLGRLPSEGCKKTMEAGQTFGA